MADGAAHFEDLGFDEKGIARENGAGEVRRLRTGTTDNRQGSSSKEKQPGIGERVKVRASVPVVGVYRSNLEAKPVWVVDSCPCPCLSAT